MIAGFMLVLSSCAVTPKPELDFDDAEDNLEDEDYDVDYYDDFDEIYVESLYAENDDDYLVITEYMDSKLANMYYKNLKAELKYEKESLQHDIDTIEHLLKKYDDDYTSSEIDEMEDELKELKKELKDLEKIVIGKSGKFVWHGTKNAIKDSKG